MNEKDRRGFSALDIAQEKKSPMVLKMNSSLSLKETKRIIGYIEKKDDTRFK